MGCLKAVNSSSVMSGSPRRASWSCLMVASTFAACSPPPRRGLRAGRKRMRRLLAAHHAEAGVGPHPREARVEGTPGHAVVPRAEAAADHERQLGYAHVRYGVDQLCTVFGDAARLILAPDHEAGNVLQKQQRNAALAA